MRPFVQFEGGLPEGYDYEQAAGILGVSVEEFKARAADVVRGSELWENDVYRVVVRRHHPPDADLVPVIHLSIRRLDNQPVKDWRDMQSIKNELTDPEFEAIELFPAESRRVDTANQYHLWVFASKEFRLPVGFRERLVTDSTDGVNGVSQRKL